MSLRAWLLGLAGGLLAAGVLAAGGSSRPSAYPVPGDQLNFSHARHAQVKCRSCHTDADSRRRPGEARRPDHAACVACHPAADRSAPAAGCPRCHRGQPQVARPRPPTLRFSHALHVGLGLDCLRCHRAADIDAGPFPRAERCAECHQDRMDGARCEICHPADAGGRLRLDGAGGRLVPRGGHGGDDHRPGWQEGHGRSARVRVGNCRRCHPEGDCDGCHRGVWRPLRQHPADWQTSHASLARAEADSCRHCHRSQKDCLRCHRQTGVAGGEQALADNLRLHPVGWSVGSVHGPQARRNLTACTACHAEGDCIRCHGAGGAGLGIRPHPADWRGRCRLMRERNPRPCTRCHPGIAPEVLCP